MYARAFKCAHCWHACFGACCGTRRYDGLRAVVLCAVARDNAIKLIYRYPKYLNMTNLYKFHIGIYRLIMKIKE